MDMESDQLQQAWRSQDIPPVTVDAETLLSLVKRNHGEFRSMIFRRDAIEIGTALALTAFFAVWGTALSLWSWFVMAAACLFVAVFMLIDRQRQRSRSPSNTESLAMCVERSRSDVEHQVWLLRNVFWLYLLPLLIGFICFYGHHIWLAQHAGTGSLAITSVLLGLFAGSCAVVYAVYLLNQRAIRNELQPRLDELRDLTDCLNSEPTDNP
jgi:hypothetical protein